MLFTESLFLFYFLPIALVVHRATLGRADSSHYPLLSRLVLLLLTLVFYGIQRPWWLLPFLLTMVTDYVWGYLLSRRGDGILRKVILFASIFQNLGLLAIFKYYEPFAALATRSALLKPWFPEITGLSQNMPAGISFYTFESMSFVIDVYRRQITFPKNPLSYFAFLGMFPRFIAGPIVRYQEVSSQFENYAGPRLERGLFIFFIGLFLKVCFADSFAVFTGYAFDEQFAGGCLATWLGLFAYHMQIYFDFSSYSLMAIGLGKCLGFCFPENFRQPYLATSFRDFWSRWHISLSRWLRDYLYIPLGGNRKGRWRELLNLTITMAVGGIWHGSRLSFLLWGLMHATFLILERSVPFTIKNRFLCRLAVTFGLMMSWVLFRAPNLGEAKRIYLTLFNMPSHAFAFSTEAFATHWLASGLCVLAIFYAYVFEPRFTWIDADETRDLSPSQRWVAIGVSGLAVIWSLSSIEIPFLYFQF